MSDADVKMPEPTGWLAVWHGEYRAFWRSSRLMRDKANAEDIVARWNASITPRVKMYEVEAIYTADQLRAAVLAERERCALICDEQGQEWESDAGRIDGPWNPVTSDGDAFRLQVALHFTVRCYMGTTCVQSTVPGGPSVYIEETNHADPYAATRLAITRAAASIGEKMRQEETAGDARDLDAYINGKDGDRHGA